MSGHFGCHYLTRCPLTPLSLLYKQPRLHADVTVNERLRAERVELELSRVALAPFCLLSPCRARIGVAIAR